MIPELYGEYRPDAPVSGGDWRQSGIAGTTTIPIDRGVQQGPEYSWNWFHPSRFGVKLADASFREQLHAIDPRLEFAWHPLHQRWVCFFREATIHFWMCPGWKRLFIVRYPDGGYMPLDERTLGEAWSRSPKVHGGNGRKYFDRVVIEHMRDQMRADTREHESYIEAVAHDRYRYAQIKNIGQGNKYANHEVAD